MDFRSLPRRTLQLLCKRNGVPANITNAAMADALASLPTVQGLDEILRQVQTPAQPTPTRPPNPPRSCRRASPVTSLLSVSPNARKRTASGRGTSSSSVSKRSRKKEDEDRRKKEDEDPKERPMLAILAPCSETTSLSVKAYNRRSIESTPGVRQNAVEGAMESDEQRRGDGGGRRSVGVQVDGEDLDNCHMPEISVLGDRMQCLLIKDPVAVDNKLCAASESPAEFSWCLDLVSECREAILCLPPTGKPEHDDSLRVEQLQAAAHLPQLLLEGSNVASNVGESIDNKRSSSPEAGCLAVVLPESENTGIPAHGGRRETQSVGIHQQGADMDARENEAVSCVPEPTPESSNMAFDCVSEISRCPQNLMPESESIGIHQKGTDMVIKENDASPESSNLAPNGGEISCCPQNSKPEIRSPAASLCESIADIPDLVPNHTLEFVTEEGEKRASAGVRQALEESADLEKEKEGGEVEAETETGKDGEEEGELSGLSLRKLRLMCKVEEKKKEEGMVKLEAKQEEEKEMQRGKRGEFEGLSLSKLKALYKKKLANNNHHLITN